VTEDLIELLEEKRDPSSPVKRSDNEFSVRNSSTSSTRLTRNASNEFSGSATASSRMRSDFSSPAKPTAGRTLKRAGSG
jgi:hypothetical protein